MNDLNVLLTAGITLTVVGIALAFGLLVQGEVKDEIGADGCAARTDTLKLYNTTSDQCYNSTNSKAAVGTAEFNATTDSISGVSNLSGQLPTVGIIVAAVIIIALLVGGFAFANRN